jgi:hypothetical protein
VPRQFSWVDQRLVFEHHLERCTIGAWGLYLFLVAVGDLRGVSYYSDRSTCSHLLISSDELVRLRSELCAAGMIACKRSVEPVSLKLGTGV